ncbi:MAG: hypothetical protein HRU28_15845 [Rhizobiales bacterium]|nr:hypothetical protein [Hyphomicrobiales bacterium]
MHQPNIKTEATWQKIAMDNVSVVLMIRGMIEEMFGTVANMESEDATVLLRGPELKHDGEAILAALRNIKLEIDKKAKC